MVAPAKPGVCSDPVAFSKSVNLSCPQALQFDNQGHTCLLFMVIMDNMMLN